MVPGDCFTDNGKTYLLLAVAGRTAAVVPIVKAFTGGYARRLRGDVVVDPVACGVPYRAAAARCAACCQVPTFDAEVTGRVSDADLRAMVDAVRRLNVSVQVEKRAAVM